MPLCPCSCSSCQYHQASRIIGVPIANGQLELTKEGKTAAPRIWLVMSSSSSYQQQINTGGEEGVPPSVTVTWNGDKIRTGSSHRCETREGEVSEERKLALDKALTELRVDIQDLTDEDQVSQVISSMPFSLSANM